MATLELIITIDADGKFRLDGIDSEGDQMNAFDETDPDRPMRTVRLKLEMAPAKPDEMAGKIPDDLSEGTVEIRKAS